MMATFRFDTKPTRDYCWQWRKGQLGNSGHALNTFQFPTGALCTRMTTALGNWHPGRYYQDMVFFISCWGRAVYDTVCEAYIMRACITILCLSELHSNRGKSWHPISLICCNEEVIWCQFWPIQSVACVVTPHMSSSMSLAQSLPESEGAVTVGWMAPSITSRAEIPWQSRSRAGLPSVFSWSFSTSLVASLSLSFSERVGGNFS